MFKFIYFYYKAVLWVLVIVTYPLYLVLSLFVDESDFNLTDKKSGRDFK